MHPIEDLFLESVSYALKFDMHFYMQSYVEKKFILVKMGVTRGVPQLHRTTSHSQASSHGGSTVGHDYTAGSPSGALVGPWVRGWLLRLP
jgi:hypothetical protein